MFCDLWTEGRSVKVWAVSVWLQACNGVMIAVFLSWQRGFILANLCCNQCCSKFIARNTKFETAAFKNAVDNSKKMYMLLFVLKSDEKNSWQIVNKNAIHPQNLAIWMVFHAMTAIKSFVLESFSCQAAFDNSIKDSIHSSRSVFYIRSSVWCVCSESWMENYSEYLFSVLLQKWPGLLLVQSLWLRSLRPPLIIPGHVPLSGFA